MVKSMEHALTFGGYTNGKLERIATYRPHPLLRLRDYEDRGAYESERAWVIVNLQILW